MLSRNGHVTMARSCYRVTVMLSCYVRSCYITVMLSCYVTIMLSCHGRVIMLWSCHGAVMLSCCHVTVILFYHVTVMLLRQVMLCYVPVMLSCHGHAIILSQEHTYQITRRHVPKYRRCDIDRFENNMKHAPNLPFSRRQVMNCRVGSVNFPELCVLREGYIQLVNNTMVWHLRSEHDN
jgi:hypothetical protein